MSGLDSLCSGLLPAPRSPRPHELYRKIAVSQQEMLSNTLLLVQVHFKAHFKALYEREEREDLVRRLNYLWSAWKELYNGGPGGIRKKNILYGMKNTVRVAFDEVTQTSSHKTSICR